MNEETKDMVLHNICFLLNQFIHCSVYENVVFCWVMHEQSIIDTILAGIDKANCEVKVISLICNPDTLRKQLEKDVKKVFAQVILLNGVLQEYRYMINSIPK